MKINKLTLDEVRFPIGYPWMDGSLVPPHDYSIAEQIAAKAIYRERSWEIYDSNCGSGEEKRRRIDASGRLMLDPILLIFGASKNGKPPTAQSKQATYQALMKAAGLKRPEELVKALGKELGLDRLPVPWAEIQKNYDPATESFKINVEVELAALRLVPQGVTFPGEVYLLVPMSASFDSWLYGVCAGEQHIVYAGKRFYYDPLRVNLSAPEGKRLQREEAKRRVQAIEEAMKELREEIEMFGGEERKARLEELHRQIDELIKY